MTGYVAVCQQCGELTDGAADLEEAGDVAEAHDEFGCDVDIYHGEIEIDSGFMCISCSVLRWGDPADECPACGERGVSRVFFGGGA
ncbi:rubrerythrin [Halarchaeum rubridurum]|uniref:Rubrerythrin n=1 Tax=Halarchaeum rubridurum TaxID=489911 RepID=A0A830FV45_9EURY|nr:hypothetical protein [Halarchaeum rubridurum]MBP1953614.1 rubrerythrin [Halarchaeum rubridurum]GGM63917.1 hypothetical protein GCM10009017_12490 [Halarchaeum rubridurum]